MVSKVIRDAPCAVLTVPRAAQFWQRHVLAAVSDTPATRSVTMLSAKIAAACDLPLALISVATDRSMQAATEQLNTENLMQARAFCPTVQGRILTGKPIEQILAAAKDLAADLIVIGRQRYHLLPFGGKGIMQQVAGALDMPTLIVP
jgi:Universal stress protein family.